MTEWNRIHNRVNLSGADGFTFLTLPYITFPEEDAKAFIKRFVPDEKHDNEFAMKRAAVDPVSAIRMYLCRTMSSSFCIGRGSRNDQSVFYIGARRPQDIFKLLLKIPESEKVTTWDSQMVFTVRVAENDDFNPDKFKNGTILRGMV